MASEDQADNSSSDIDEVPRIYMDQHRENPENYVMNNSCENSADLKKEVDELIVLRHKMVSMMEDLDKRIKLPTPQCNESGRTALPSSKRNHELKEEDYECAICLRLLFEPVTLRCGHSFCRSCCRSLLHQNHAKCPSCRKVLPSMLVNQLETSFTLAKLLENAFPKEYSERLFEQKLAAIKRAAGNSMNHSNDIMSSIPIFYLDPMLPRQQMTLNIFEPRYILMITRCMEGSSRFGMMGHRDMQGGVEVEIIESSFQLDGRILLKVRASHRCFIIPQGGNTRSNIWIKDGYTMANVQWLPLPTIPIQLDASQESVEESLRAVMDFAVALEPLVETWTKLVENGGWQQYSGQLRRCLEEIGPMPRADNCQGAVDRALWVGALINPLPGLGVAAEIRPSLLLYIAQGDAYQALEKITTEIQRSIDYLKPNEFFHWMNYYFNKILVHGIGAGPPPPAPSLAHIAKALLQIILIAGVVSSLLWRVIHQLTSTFVHDEF